jgi:hypothetical protein
MRSRLFKLRFSTMLAGLAALIAAGPALAGGSIVLTSANNIQATINSGLYDEIILSAGVYNQTIMINAANAPLTIRSMDPADQATVDSTILDGQFLGDSVITVMSGTGSDMVFDGLTIRNGEALGGSPDDRGGGINCQTASPTVRRCVFLDNDASFAGGAFYVNAGLPVVEDCTFIGNMAPLGGAVYCNNSTVQFMRCYFEANSASNEGGACRLVGGSYSFEQCEFFDNDSVNFGGAIAVRTTAMLTVSRCLFESNFSGDGGANGRGGAILHDGSDNAVVENSVFRNNAVTQFGASIYTFQTITVRNTTHYGDTAGAGNVFSIPTGGLLNLHNSVVWAFVGGDAISVSGSKVVTHSNIQGGWAGTGNIGADSGDEPLFADAANGDFRLLPGSAGIDAGDTTKVPGQYPVDYDGLPRAIDDPDMADSGIAMVALSVDMGAFELQVEPAPPMPQCPGDVDGSGVVDVTDLLALLAGWGACP